MNIDEYAAAQLTLKAIAAERVGREVVNNELVKWAAFAMQRGLDEQKPFVTPDRWWHPKTETGPIRDLLLEKALAGEMVEVMNLAAILWGKEQMLKLYSQKLQKHAQRMAHQAQQAASKNTPELEIDGEVIRPSKAG